MGDDSPYERVTDPERFAVLHEAADELVAELQERFDVVVTPIEPEGGDLRSPAVSAVRVSPRNDGAAVSITKTTFPGLYVRFGSEHSEQFPQCGCDACDEQPDEVAHGLREKVLAVARSRFSGPPGGYAFVFDDGRQAGGRPVRRLWRRRPTRRYEAWPPVDLGVRHDAPRAGLGSTRAPALAEMDTQRPQADARAAGRPAGRC